MHRISASDGWALLGEHTLLRTATAGQSWTDITPPLTAGQMIDKAYFLDFDHGWVLLHSSDAETALPAISVAATEDGGKTWSVRPFPADIFPPQSYGNGGDFSFVDDTHGWMILREISSSAGSYASVFATADGGKGWTALPVPPINGRIQFVTQSTGWLLGGIGDGDLYRTRDGGRTWLQQSIPLPDGVQPYADPQFGPGFVMRPVYQKLFFKTPQYGLLAITVQVERTSSKLLTYGTEDGGDSWHLKKMESDLSESLAAFDSTLLEISYRSGAVSLRRDSGTISASLPKGLPRGQVPLKADFLTRSMAGSYYAAASALSRAVPIPH